MGPYVPGMSNLKWIGCVGDGTNGCAKETFYCNDISGGNGIEFGTTSTDGALRALLGSVFVTSSNVACASHDSPYEISNAPDQASSVTALCVQLGWTTGTLVNSGTANSCPEVFFDSSAGAQMWSSDFLLSNGYGKQFSCTP